MITFLFTQLFSFSTQAQTANDSFFWPMYMPSIIVNSHPGKPEKGYIDNGDGTISSYETGLIWQKSASEYLPWSDAVKYCAKLTLANNSDWHLPTKDELKSLVFCSNGHPTPLEDWDNQAPGSFDIEAHTCCNNSPACDNFKTPVIDPLFISYNWGDHWAMDEDNRYLPLEQAWSVNFYKGSCWSLDKVNYRSVRCVRK